MLFNNKIPDGIAETKISSFFLHVEPIFILDKFLSFRCLAVKVSLNKKFFFFIDKRWSMSGTSHDKKREVPISMDSKGSASTCGGHNELVTTHHPPCGFGITSRVRKIMSLLSIS